MTPKDAAAAVRDAQARYDALSDHGRMAAELGDLRAIDDYGEPEFAPDLDDLLSAQIDVEYARLMFREVTR